MRNGRWRGLGVCALSAWAMGACDGGSRPVGSSAATGDGGVELAVATEALLPGCSSVDVPDDGGLDSDGDGIDGTARCAVIVDPSGSDWDGCGTPTDPCRTLGYAIEEAVTGGYPQVLVSGELYSTSPITIRGQVGVHGGYRRTGSTYTRAGGATARLEGSGAGPTIRVDAGTLPVTLDRLVIVAPAGSAEAAHPAVHLLGSTQVTLRGCELRAPDLGATWWTVRRRAQAGHTYVPATRGEPGSVPMGGAGGGGYGGYLDLGGRGGNGASGSATAGLPGARGEGGAQGGVGGLPGACSFASSPGAGGRGADGTAGYEGVNGTQVGTLGVFSGGRYYHYANAGGVGGPGGGGGGGGGGGAALSPLFGCVAGTGGGGGGGGGGGAHGTGGRAGAAGEPSVALVIEGASGRVSGATLFRTRLVAARGGVGQAGGHGGRGGEGAEGGAGASSTSGGRGGDGGRGGRGGGGGGGAGGSGGVSVCAWMQAGTLWHDAASTCATASTRAPGAEPGCRVDAAGTPTASCGARGYAGVIAQVVSCDPGACATSTF